MTAPATTFSFPGSMLSAPKKKRVLLIDAHARPSETCEPGS